jgi:hypothetical protein
MDMNSVAESYVRLVLAVGEHDPDYVDAYYGPKAWRDEVMKKKMSLAEIRKEAYRLIEGLALIGMTSRFDEMGYLRHQYLTKQLESLSARVDMLEGKNFTFEEEARALYDAEPPAHTAAHFEEALQELARVLPAGDGGGTLQERFERYVAGFVIPKDRLDTVFRTAIDECRKRTNAEVDLPEGENFVVEFVTDKPWSAYNWYQGNGRSLIQVNTDLPITIDRAIDLAAHEGYPGHHVYNALLEKHLVRERGWVEFSVYPLFSPQSLIAEGSANFGKQVVFPNEERLRFEREALFPLAGLDPSQVETYDHVMDLKQRLSYADNEAARNYMNGKFSKEDAVDWLMKYNLMSRERAEQRVRFIERYRSYVINYNLGEDLVRDFVTARVGKDGNVWKEFTALLSSPRLPSGLK